MHKSCGGCRFFVKVRMSGLCELHDWSCKSDNTCKNWKPKGYKRERLKMEATEEEAEK